MHFADGIASQPAALDRSRTQVAAALPGLPTPRPDEVVGLIGIGASEHIARSAAHVWREAGLRAFALSASEVTAAGAGSADVYVAISESGRSTETLDAVASIGARPSLAVVNDPESPLAGACGAVLDIGSGEDSPVYTTGYTATLQALGMLGEHWTGGSTDWSELPALTRQVLDDARGTVDELSAGIADARIVDVVATGSSAATAGEGALLLRESARLLTAAHDTRDYLHGPMEPLGPEVACLIAGDGREVRLARDTAALGCPTLLLTCAGDVASSGALTVLRLPRPASALGRAVLEILPFQLLAWSVARRRGLSVDGFRYRQDDTKSGAA